MNEKRFFLSTEDIKDGEKIKLLFESLGETEKLMACVYISALRDKELASVNQKAG